MLFSHPLINQLIELCIHCGRITVGVIANKNSHFSGLLQWKFSGEYCTWQEVHPLMMARYVYYVRVNTNLMSTEIAAVSEDNMDLRKEHT
jgi:hypothetical protein